MGQYILEELRDTKVGTALNLFLKNLMISVILMLNLLLMLTNKRLKARLLLLFSKINKIIKTKLPHKLNLKKEWQLKIKMEINLFKEFQVLVEYKGNPNNKLMKMTL